MSSVFTEYWLFVKNKKGEWGLSKIYQCDELNTIQYRINIKNVKI